MRWLRKAARFAAVGLGLISRPDLIVRFVADHPHQEAMEAGVIYVVGGPGYQKWALFRCPHDEEEIIQLSLMPNRRPRWTITADFLERPTLDPSVRQLAGFLRAFLGQARKGRLVRRQRAAAALGGDGLGRLPPATRTITPLL